MGITVNMYGDKSGTERIFPFDVPRIVAAADWNVLERGLRQRVHGLSLFIEDIYYKQKIEEARKSAAEATATAQQKVDQAAGEVK